VDVANSTNKPVVWVSYGKGAMAYSFEYYTQTKQNVPPVLSPHRTFNYRKKTTRMHAVSMFLNKLSHIEIRQFIIEKMQLFLHTPIVQVRHLILVVLCGWRSSDLHVLNKDVVVLICKMILNETRQNGSRSFR
jgi:hypothetical protein